MKKQSAGTQIRVTKKARSKINKIVAESDRWRYPWEFVNHMLERHEAEKHIDQHNGVQP